MDSLLCVANFPASTGYAWTFIGRMFAEVANALARGGIRTLVAYPLLDTSPEALAGSAAEPLGADLSLGSLGSVLAGLELVRREHVRAVWLIDRPVISPAYAALHAAGVRRVVVHDHTSGALPLGDGPERARLEAQRARLRTGARVRLAGQRPDAADCVAAADVCVVPSRWEEAFCLAAAEALARARPVVATRVGAIPELVRDGVTGVLVPPADPSALAGAIRHLLEMPELAAALGQAGRAHLLAAHGWPRAVAGLVSVFAPAFGATLHVGSGAPIPKR